jgi:alkanesulfonate monooxygenase SsuD/methylene tetrahydromethanopterin reductase-like flavin-dependent oxidoreductase (luciferase family)
MRTTRALPRSSAGLYRELADDARLAESLGFHSLWIAEHHFWYDGWCPAPVIAAAAVFGATERLHVGTGIYQLPLHDAAAAAADAETLQRLSGGRFEFGVGLGYRDAEFDAFGLARAERGRRMEAALELLTGRWRDGGGPQIWVGGFAERPIRRAARLGTGLLLPPTLTAAQVDQVIAIARSAADESGTPMGPVGMMRHAWLTDGSKSAAMRAATAIAASIREYTGAWFRLRERPGFEVPELLDRQVQRAVDNALIGSPQQLIERMREFEAAGVSLTVLQLTSDGQRVAHRDNMAAIAAEVLPSVV